MHTLRVHALSLGCPKNRVDSERMLASLGPGLVPCDDPAAADLVLVNTCGFIAPAVAESVRAVLDLAAAIADASPRPLLAVAGCLVNRYGAELARELPEVDLWLRIEEEGELAARAAAALKRRVPAPLAFPRALSTGPGYAYLKIGEGCGNACAFCTIPSIRGPLRSRPAAELAAEARGILEQGVPEIVLVAQDLTAWGRDLGEKRGLRRLLDELLPLPGLRRLRLMYLYPAGLTPDLLDYLAGAGAPLVPYFDIPLQHAHPDVLKAMGRPFARDPRLVLDRVRARFPEAAIRTSLITGFPGETLAHFRALVRFVQEARLHHLGVFAYCDEEGTRSHRLPDKVSSRAAQARRRRIMEIQAEISAEILSGYVGQTLDIVVDAPHPEWPGLHVGRAWFQAPEADGVTYVSGPGVAPGRMVAAEIEESQTYDLVALA
ncbi:MAG: 30S ribosomal protein S12 methylthiotransferase RimO [Thermodesulfobacteriota bacterium]